jgi:hypothetical protein
MVSMLRICGIVLLPLIAMLLSVSPVYAVAPSMSLDGVAVGNSYSCDTSSCFSLCSTHQNCSASAALTTTNGDDVIIVVAQCGIFQNCASCCPSPSSVDNITSIVDDGGHTWILRAAYTPPGGRPIWEYYAVAHSPVSEDRINVTWSGSNIFVGFIALSVSGANTQHPWDPSRTLPAEQALASGCTNPRTCTINFSAVASEDFVIVSTAINDDQSCQGISPFHSAANAIFGQAETDYLVTRVGGSNSLSFTCSDSSPVTILGDALQGPGRN